MRLRESRKSEHLSRWLSSGVLITAEYNMHVRCHKEAASVGSSSAEPKHGVISARGASRHGQLSEMNASRYVQALVTKAFFEERSGTKRQGCCPESKRQSYLSEPCGRGGTSADPGGTELMPSCGRGGAPADPGGYKAGARKPGARVI